MMDRKSGSVSLSKKVTSLVLIMGLGMQVCWTNGEEVIKKLSREDQSKKTLMQEKKINEMGKKIVENHEQKNVEEAIQQPVEKEDAYDKEGKMQILKDIPQSQEPVLVEEKDVYDKEGKMQILKDIPQSQEPVLVEEKDVYDKEGKMQILKDIPQSHEPILVEERVSGEVLKNAQPQTLPPVITEEVGKEPKLSIEEIRATVEKLRRERLKEITPPSESTKTESILPSKEKIRIEESPKPK